MQADVYALARPGYMNYMNYLKLLHQSYKHKDNLTIWTSILNQLTDFNSVFDYAYVDKQKKVS
jgi:hypothetical protein